MGQYNIALLRCAQTRPAHDVARSVGEIKLISCLDYSSSVLYLKGLSYLVITE